MAALNHVFLIGNIDVDLMQKEIKQCCNFFQNDNKSIFFQNNKLLYLFVCIERQESEWFSSAAKFLN